MCSTPKGKFLIILLRRRSSFNGKISHHYIASAGEYDGERVLKIDRHFGEVVLIVAAVLMMMMMMMMIMMMMMSFVL